jgi:hypothetical protein
MLAATVLQFGALAGKLVWLTLIVIRWAHATFVARPVDFWLDTVLGSWEEALKSAVSCAAPVLGFGSNNISCEHLAGWSWW